MRYFIKIIFLLSTTIPVLISCHFNSQFINREEDKKEAEKTADKLFDLLSKKEYEETATLFSKNFFGYTSKEKLVDLFSATNKSK